jgi:hypothetical protein
MSCRCPYQRAEEGASFEGIAPRGTRHAKRPSTQLDDGDVEYVEHPKRKPHLKKRRITPPDADPIPLGWQLPPLSVPPRS